MKRVLEVYGLSILVLSIFPFMMGSSCQFDTTMDGIRSAHSGVREGFQLSDGVLAPMYSDAHQLCLAEADERGLTEQPGMDYYNRCMESWNQIEEIFSSIRECLHELENIYQDIENGVDRNSDYRLWIRRLFDHTQTIMRLLEILEVDIPDGLMNSVEGICTIIGCED